MNHSFAGYKRWTDPPLPSSSCTEEAGQLQQVPLHPQQTAGGSELDHQADSEAKQYHHNILSEIKGFNKLAPLPLNSTLSCSFISCHIFPYHVNRYQVQHPVYSAPSLLYTTVCPVQASRQRPKSRVTKITHLLLAHLPTCILICDQSTEQAETKVHGHPPPPSS